MSFKAFCLFLMVLLVPAHSLAVPKCEKPTTAKELVQAGVAGERAFADIDEETLLRHSSRAREKILPCLKDKIGPSEAAAFHRLMALEAFTHKSDLRTVREFHAARKLFPGYFLPEDLAGPEHPLRKLYVQAETLDDGLTEKVFPPEKGYLMVGGIRNAPRFSNTPVLIQVFASGDRLLETRYFQPGEKLPDWGKLNPMGITAQDLGIDTTPFWKKPNTWWITAGALAVVGVGFYGTGLYEKSQFNDSGTKDQDLRGYQTRANAFGYTGLAALGLSVISAGVGLGMHLTFGGEEGVKVQPSAWTPPADHREGFGHVFR